MRLRNLKLLLVLLLAAGCSGPVGGDDAGAGGGEGGGGGDGGGVGGGAGGGGGGGGTRDSGVVDAGFGPVAIAEFCSSRAWARCDRDRRCGANSTAYAFDECLRTELRTCDAPAFTSAVLGSRMLYDAQKAADCLNGYAKGSCALEPAACTGIFVGSQTSEEGCLINEECAAGTYCYEGFLQCPFTCKAFQPPGAICNYGDRECDEKLAYCEYDGGTSQCFATTPLGSPCSVFNYGECGRGNSCSAPSGTVGTCVKTNAKLGEPCRVTNNYPFCDAESLCRQEGDPNQPPLQPGVCAKRVGLNGTCTGSYGICQQGLRCTGVYTTGKCVRLGVEGDICSNYGDCETGSWCDERTSRCTRFPGDGGSCVDSYYCQPGFFCDYVTDICKPRRPDGARCDDNPSACESECTYLLLTDGGYGNLCVAACSVRTDGGV